MMSISFWIFSLISIYKRNSISGLQLLFLTFYVVTLLISKELVIDNIPNYIVRYGIFLTYFIIWISSILIFLIVKILKNELRK